MPSKRDARRWRARARAAAASRDSAVIDLPEPDSPTRPMTSPGATAEVDAVAGSACRRCDSDRSSISSRLIRCRRRLRIEDVAQAVAEQVEAEHGDDDRHAGKDRQSTAPPPCGSARRTACGPSSASAAARRGRHRRARPRRGCRARTGSCPAPAAGWRCWAGCARSVISVVPLPATRAARMKSRGQSASAAGAGDAGEDRNVEDADGDDGVDRARPEDRGDHDRRQQRREGEDEIVAAA